MERRGFTLIEILVVIAIIGLLSSIITSGLYSARSKGQNGNRLQTIQSLQTALELYYASYNSYPSTGGAWYSSEPGDRVPNGPGNNGKWIPGLIDLGIVSSLPRDPKGGVSNNPACAGGWLRAYLYISGGVGYKLVANCSPEGTWPSTMKFYDPKRPTSAWMVCKMGTLDECLI